MTITVDDLRAMQQLAQDVFRFDPRLSDSDSTVGELAWSIGQRLVRDDVWPKKLYRSVGFRELSYNQLFVKP